MAQQRSVMFLPSLILFPEFSPSLPHPLGAVLEVHHHDQLLLVLHINRRNGDVSDNPELAAVVQMLVLQSEKVPNKPSEDFCNLLNTPNQLVGEASRLFENKSEHPEESKDDVFAMAR